MLKVNQTVLCWIVLGSTLLSGCSSPGGLTPSDITGLWVETPAPGGGTPCAVIEFRTDGTFAARNIPREHFISEAVSGLPRVQALGTWAIEDIRGTQFVDIFIEVNLEWLYNSARHSTLYIDDRIGDAPHLYASAYDDDERVTFAKQDTADC
jgi:hypothetical protein